MLERKEIKKVIPHREPFLLLDSIIDYQPGKYGKGIYIPKEEEYYFEGHFPNNPILPGVIMIESAAQLGAFVVLSLFKDEKKIAYFGGIEKFRFKKIVKPGDKLKIYVELEKMRRNIGKGWAEGSVKGELAFDGGMTFVVTER